jgi:hypothetical protein
VWKCFLGIDVNVFVGFPSHFLVEIAGEVAELYVLLQTIWGEGPVPGFLRLPDPCHTQT